MLFQKFQKYIVCPFCIYAGRVILVQLHFTDGDTLNYFCKLGTLVGYVRCECSLYYTESTREAMMNTAYIHSQSTFYCCKELFILALLNKYETMIKIIWT
jgi:hypothetical protein